MLSKICNAITGVILVVMIVAAVLLVGPYLINMKTYAVLSGSMEPNIHVGSLVYVKMATPQEVKPNDVITFKLAEDNMLATHRVVRVDEQAGQFITKGDANNTEDNPIPFDVLVGKALFSIPYLGYLTVAIKTKQGIIIAAALLIVLVLLTFLPEIISPKAEEKPQKMNG